MNEKISFYELKFAVCEHIFHGRREMMGLRWHDTKWNLIPIAIISRLHRLENIFHVAFLFPPQKTTKKYFHAF